MAVETTPTEMNRWTGSAGELLARGVTLVAVIVACSVATFTAIDAARAPERRAHGPHPVAPGAVAPASTGGVEQRLSFGVLGVHEPNFVRGVSAKALAGQSHGIQDYVPPQRQLVQVPVTIYNDSDDPVAYRSGQFELVRALRGAERIMPVASSSLHPGRLQPRASIEGVVSFVVPRDGADLSLRFREPGNSRSHRIPLGSSGAVYRPRRGDRAAHGAGHHTTHESHAGH